MKVLMSVDAKNDTNPQVLIKGTAIIARVQSIDFRFGKVVAMFQAFDGARTCTYNFSEIEWINESDESIPSLPAQPEAGEGQVYLPGDLLVGEWFDENIDEDCSASSAIYKFRLWLKSLANTTK